MLKKIFVFLQLIIFITFNEIFSQNAIKQVQANYEKIIHFDKNDYHLREISPNYQGPVAGVQGLYAGDNYLIIWDNRNAFVFDLKTYTKLATLTPPMSVDDIVEKNGVIYCLCTPIRTDDRIYIYDSFDSFREYIYPSQFQNLTEYKAFRNEYKGDQNIEQKEMRKRRPSSTAVPMPINHIRSLHISEGKLLANIEFNYFSIEQDFNVEKDNEQFYLFTNHTIQKKELKWLPFLLNGTLLSYSRTKLNDKYIKMEFNLHNRNYNFIKKEEIALESDDNIGKIVSTIPISLIDDCIILRCARDFKNKNFCEDFILIVNLKTKEMQNIRLPDNIKNMGVVTNYLKYSSFSNSSIFLISYNSDLSFDILKVEVK